MGKTERVISNLALSIEHFSYKKNCPRSFNLFNPQLETRNLQLSFLLPRTFTDNHGRLPSKKSSGKTEIGSEKSSEISSEKSSEKEKEGIIELLTKTPTLTIRELSEELGLSTRAIEKQISSLKKSGKLIRKGSRREGQWEVIN